jgi:hypothetical protein
MSSPRPPRPLQFPHAMTCAVHRPRQCTEPGGRHRFSDKRTALDSFNDLSPSPCRRDIVKAMTERPTIEDTLHTSLVGMKTKGDFSSPSTRSYRSTTPPVRTCVGHAEDCCRASCRRPSRPCRSPPLLGEPRGHLRDRRAPARRASSRAPRATRGCSASLGGISETCPSLLDEPRAELRDLPEPARRGPGASPRPARTCSARRGPSFFGCMSDRAISAGRTRGSPRALSSPYFAGVASAGASEVRPATSAASPAALRCAAASRRWLSSSKVANSFASYPSGSFAPPATSS